MDFVTVGMRLRESRLRAGLTLGQVGTYEGISAQYLSDIERGRNDPNVWRLITRLADRYATSTDYLLGRTLDPAPPAALIPGEQRVEYTAWPPWLDELATLARAMSDRGRAHLLAMARALAEEDRQWLIHDELVAEIMEVAPLELDRLEALVRELGRDAAAGILLAELLAALQAQPGRNQRQQG